MKRLPCKNGCRETGATLRGGRPYLMGPSPRFFPFVYHCAGCKRPTKLEATDWARLPRLTTEQLAGLGELEPILKDYIGTGLEQAHAADCYRAGLRPAELEAMKR